MLDIANQSPDPVTLTVARRSRPGSAGTGPIGAGASTQLSVEVSPGTYEIGATPRRATGGSHPLPGAVLRVGTARPSGDNVLLRP